jgi:hypothetical protein
LPAGVVEERHVARIFRGVNVGVSETVGDADCSATRA